MTDSPRWVKWHFSKWRTDPGLRMCSLAARGIWMDLLALMHEEGEPYGHLCIRGRCPTTQQIANLIGAPHDEVNACMMELEANGVFSRTDENLIFSRRLVRDKIAMERDRANGGRGGNPKLKKRVKPTVNGGVNPSHNPPVNEGVKAELELELELEEESIPHADARVIQTAVVDEVKVAFEKYNQAAGLLGLPTAGKLTPQRRQKIGIRLRDGGMPAWEKALSAIGANTFLQGENDRGWRADLDFICQEKSWRKLQEGSYSRGAVRKPDSYDDTPLLSGAIP